jgi:hypothetical protein
MGILIPIFGILASIIAILAGTYLKVQKLKLEGLGSGEKKFLLDKIAQLEKDNAQLHARVENVETSVGGIDLELLKLGGEENWKK